MYVAGRVGGWIYSGKGDKEREREKEKGKQKERGRKEESKKDCEIRYY
jgi:hypothetical protein